MITYITQALLDSIDHAALLLIFFCLLTLILMSTKMFRRYIPFTSQYTCVSFFFILTSGWILLRIGMWIFFLIQITFVSPYVRFQLASPLVVSERAAAWNFPRLQETVDKHLANKQQTLASETQFTEKQLELLTNGLDEAESFRQSLHEQYPSGQTRAQATAKAIMRFQEAAAPHLSNRPSLERFYLDEQELMDQMNGEVEQVLGALAFQYFNGKWYGKWDQNEVNHQWDPSYEFEPPINANTTHPMCIRTLQYAWIGDGFGWNVVAAPGCKNTGDVILGTVYHVRNQNPDEIYLHRPHVGIALGEGQLIWITERDVFLEEAIPGDNPSEDQYAITGFYYEIKDGKFTNRKDAFQAVYTRNPDNRPEWYRFPFELSIDL